MWYVPAYWPWACYIPREELNSQTDRRYEIRRWINDNCRHMVYGWNHCSYVESGESNYARKLNPYGDITLYFTDYEDFLAFQLSRDPQELLQGHAAPAHY